MSSLISTISKSFYLIGEDTLVIKCAEVLLKKNQKILGIVAKNIKIIIWCQNNKVAHFKNLNDFSLVAKETVFDYLFSIVNPHKLSNDILSLPKHLAVNYHDSLLPQYAGVNATSWAIYNQEKSHGITWHIMSEGLDLGDILKQIEFPIDASETTLSLNLKCFQAAIYTFSELVDELLINNYCRKQQDLSKRTYYPSRKKIYGNGWICWDNDAENIERDYRALHFGDYKNELGALKCIINQGAYVVKDVRISEQKSVYSPGIISNFSNDEIHITTKNHDIIITRILKIDGSSQKIEDLIKSELRIGLKLESPNNSSLETYQEISSDIFKDEKYWVEEHSQRNYVKFPFLLLPIKLDFENAKFYECKLPEGIIKLASIYKCSIEKIVLAILLLYFYRTNQQTPLSIDIICREKTNIDNNINLLISNSKILNFKLNSEFKFQNIISLINCSSIEKRNYYLRDIFFRYPELSNCSNRSTLNIIFDDLKTESTIKSSQPLNFLINKNKFCVYVDQDCLGDNLISILKNIPDHLNVLVNAIISNIETTLNDLPLLTLEEAKKILVDWNKTRKSYPIDKTIPQLFEEQVRENPYQVAVVCGDKKITYAELNKKSSHLADQLIKEGIGAGDIVAICLERDEKMIIGILSILKAGAAYVPFDHSYPAERVKFILEDTNCKLILTNNFQQKKYEKISFAKIKIIDISYFLERISLDTITFTNQISPESLCYIMYTSGSTGSPKGVMVSHRNVIKLVKDIDYVTITNSDCFAQISSYVFDASTFEMWGALLNGAKILIVGKSQLLCTVDLYKEFKRHNVSIAFFTSSLFNEICRQNPEILSDIPKLLVGGEKLNFNIIKKFFYARRGKLSLYNAYGPTECTTFSCVYKIDHISDSLSAIPIGRPVCNTQCYILDKYLMPVPVGFDGELFIGGDGVATGYTKEERMLDKFIQDPFAEEGMNKFLYRTGDIVRWLPDGNIEFIDRCDDQVKIRGFRIEIGEIETKLTEWEKMSQVVACVRDTQNQKQVEVYYIKDKNSSCIAPKDIQLYLRKKLPEYMLPSKIIEVENFPLTINGKVDKQLLLAQDYGIKTQRLITNPSSSIEKIILEVWKQVLKIKEIDIDDNFFSLGGDSIMAMQIVTKVKEHGYRISVKDIFQAPTIKNLSKLVKNVDPIADEYITSGSKFPLSPIQSWFFEQSFKDKSQFTQVCVLTIKDPPFNLSLFKYAFKETISAHHAFSLRFRCYRQGWMQIFSPSLGDAIDIEVCDSTQCLELNSLIKQASLKIQKNFNLEKGPLIRIIIFLGHDNTSVKCLIAIHHLIIDGVSWRIMLEELQANYQKLILSETIMLSKEVTTTQAWIKELKKYSNSTNLEAEEEFWNSMDQYVPIPVDHRTGMNLEKYSDSIMLECNKSETKLLLNGLLRTKNVTLQEILIGLLTKSITNWTKKSEITIDMESHGRVEFGERLDLNKTVGWFTSLYPIYFSVLKGTTWEVINSIKKQLRSIPNNGIGYGLLRYLKKVSFSGKSDIAFNYWGHFDQIFNDNKFIFESLSLASSPENKRSYLINIDASIKNQSLCIIWTYSKNFHNKSTIESLANQFKSDLISLISLLNDSNDIKSELVNRNFKKNENKKYLLNSKKSYNLSSLQQGLLFHSNYNTSSEAYIIQLIWRSPKNSDLDLECLKKAWQRLIERHDLLRTSFSLSKMSDPIQIIADNVDLSWREYNWRDLLSERAIELRINNFIKEDRRARFNLECPPLFRITIININDFTFYLIITFHHILMDGWSLPILMKELELIYFSLKNNTSIILTQPISYFNYIDWCAQQNYDSAEIFWIDYFKGFSSPANLPFLKNNISSEDKNSSAFECKEICLDKQRNRKLLTQKINNFSRQWEFSPNTFFQGIWAVLINFYSQNDDVVFGIPVTGRSTEIVDSDKIIGLVINTLPLRIKFKKIFSVIDLLKEIQNTLSNITEYHYTPLSKLLEWINVPHEEFLFNSIVAFENYPIDNELELFKFKDIKIIDPTHYPLTCSIFPGDQTIIKISYNRNMIDGGVIENLLKHVFSIITETLNNPLKSVFQIDILTKLEKRQIIFDFNKTKNINFNKNFILLFEEQVERTPNNIAIGFNGEFLTYSELNRRVNELAHYLLDYGIKLEDLIALCVDRNVDMIIAVLAIIKSGAAYVPIDLSLPKNRIVYMLNDSAPSLIITQKSSWKYNEDITLKAGRIIFIDDLPELSSYSKINPKIKYKKNHLVYVIYTSGSTGNPKGVLIEHHSLVNLLCTMRERLLPTSEDTFLSISPITFDIFGLEFYLPLMVGAKCIIADRNTISDGIKLNSILSQYKISILQATPMTWKMLIAAGWNGPYPQKALCGGEALSKELAGQIYKRVDAFWNGYGPTESTIYATIFDFFSNINNRFTPPIGKPLENIQAYIMDHHLRPLPVGQIGQLYLGGVGLARGYLNQDNLTKEKFTIHPSIKNHNTKIYATGDLVRWLEDGNIEYIGRIDDQIKINGFRVELGEIQYHLETHPCVEQSIVVYKEIIKDEKRIIAYIIPRNNKSINVKSLREYLKNKIPVFMLPSFYCLLDKFPVTHNGKVDKNSLPAIHEIQNINNHDSEILSKTENTLASIWCKTLCVNSIKKNDNFFEAGGNSLSSLKTLNEINDHFRLDLPLSILFEKPTITQLSETVDISILEKSVLDVVTNKTKVIKTNSCLLPLKSHGRKAPLFLIHPVGGTVFWYIPLVKYLEKERPVYAIQDPGIENNKISFTSIEEMATFYIKTIKKVKPSGPYLLGGASAGANICFEMAYQLNLLGEVVDFVGLFDGWAYYPEELDRQELFETFMRRQFNAMQKKFSAIGIYKAESILELQWERSKIYRRYRPSLYPGTLTLFKAEETIALFANIESKYNHWEKGSPNSIELYTVPGDHETMFQEPNVATLGARINKCLLITQKKERKIINQKVISRVTNHFSE